MKPDDVSRLPQREPLQVVEVTEVKGLTLNPDGSTALRMDVVLDDGRRLDLEVAGSWEVVGPTV